MKTSLLALLGLLSMTVLQAQEHSASYESLWNSVAQLERQDLPQSKLKVLGQVLEKARHEQNRPQALRAVWEVYQTSLRIDRKSGPQAYETFRSYAPFFRETPAAHAAFLCLDLDLQIQQGAIQERPALLRTTLDTLLVMQDSLLAQSPAPYTRLLSYNDSYFQAQNLYQQVLLKLLDLVNRLRYSTIPWVEETYIHLIQNYIDSCTPGSPSYLHAQCLYIRTQYARDPEAKLRAWDGLIAAWPEHAGIEEIWLEKLEQEMERIRESLPAEEMLSEARLREMEAAYQAVLDRCLLLLKQFPNGRWASRFREIQKDLQRPGLYLRDGLPTQAYPGDSLHVAFRYTNLPSVAWTVYRMPDRYTALPAHLGLYNPTDRAKLLRLGTLLESGSIPLRKALAVEQEGQFRYRFTRPGSYLIYLGHGSETLYEFVQVSHVAAAYRQRQGRWELFCADFKSGRPLDRASLTWLKDNGYSEKGRYSPLGRSTAVALDGFTPVTPPKTENSLFFRVAAAGPGFATDSAAVPSGPLYSWGQSLLQESSHFVALFTDRKLYKPGDSLQVKGVYYHESRLNPPVYLADRKLNVFLHGPGQSAPLDTFEVVTNAFGSFSLSLRLPQGGLNGVHSLRCGMGQTDFRVEVYENPKFEVSLEPVKEAFSFGSAVAPQGHIASYTGVSMAGARVQYEVFCRPLMQPWLGAWYRPIFFPEVQVAQGETVADAHGNFLCPFTLSRPEGRPLREALRCEYEVVVRATDAAGETRQARTALYVGDIPYVLHSNLDQLTSARLLVKERAGELMIAVRNLSGEEQGLPGNFRVCKGDSCLLQGGFVGGKPLVLPWTDFPSGALRLEYEISYKGQKLCETEDFVLVGLSDTAMPLEQTALFHPLSETELDFLLGTSEDSLYVQVELFNGDSLLWREPQVLSSGLRRIRLPWPVGARDHVNLSLYYICKGKGMQHRHTVHLPKPDLGLGIQFQALRESYLPAQAQRFSLLIQPTDSSAALRPTEALVAIFDKGTEQFGKNLWELPHFTFRPQDLLPAIRESFSSGPENEMMTYGVRKLGRGAVMNMPMALNMKAAAVAVQDMADSVVEEETMKETAAIEAGAGETPPALRSDFAQTLAFVPHLQADSTGAVAVDFRTSDALSTFMVKVFAHTADGYHGQAETSFMVRKDLMTQGHLPSFIREGDRLVVQARVSNLTEAPLQGTAHLRCFDGAAGRLSDPETALRVAPEGLEAHPLTLQAGETGLVAWTLQAPSAEELPLLGLRLWFEAGDQSDGEEHLLPVLSSTEHLTLSRVYVLEGAGLSGTDLDSLRAAVLADCREEAARGLGSGILEEGRLQMRITTPLREALTALPALTAPTSDNLVDWVAALYATCTGAKLLQDSPSLRAYVEEEVAKQRAGALQHRLELNQDLTGTLLEETPWAEIPALEAQRVERLASLSDPAYVAEIRKEAERRFHRLQGADGGFAWFPEMGSSEDLTLFWIETLTRLQEGGALTWDAELRRRVAKAWGYLDLRLAAWHKDLMARLVKHPELEPKHLGLYFRRYLHLRSAAPDQSFKPEARKAYDYLIEILGREAEADRDLMEKALTADIWYRVGQPWKGDATLASLREYAVSNPTLGLYFPRAVHSPGLLGSTLKAHALLLELFHRHSSLHPAYAATVKGLQQWLVLQKENQQWSNAPATCDVVQALVRTGAAGAAPGSPEALGPQFVSFFYDYRRPAAGVEATGTGLHVERSFLRAVGSGEDLSWEPLPAEAVLQTGQKIRIRTRLHSDELRSFVQLRSALPANLSPEMATSGVVWNLRVAAYREVRGHSLNYYIQTLDSGEVVFEEDFVVTQRGRFQSGLARLQSLYAPQYRGHQGGPVLQSE